ncbi:hypothetical protein IIC38_01485 [candidate division KSB1 bacterium]|nr:hypothetical protein [candidate division KSB1 bacterium]
MKIHSAYLQNQIPDNSPVRPIKEQTVEPFKEVLKNQPIKQKENVNEGEVKLELSEVSNRILSASEKDAISQLFLEEKQEITYDRLGKRGNPELPIGQRIDVKG